MIILTMKYVTRLANGTANRTSSETFGTAQSSLTTLRASSLKKENMFSLILSVRRKWNAQTIYYRL